MLQDPFIPSCLSEFIGQKKAKAKLDLAICGAAFSDRFPPHILFVGRPGTGKTTLAKVVAQELQAEFKSVMGPSIKTIEDLIDLLLTFDYNANHTQVLFIDEIHSLPREVEERLYTILENWTIEMKDPKGEYKVFRTPIIWIMGATTKLGEVSKPLRDRFGLIVELEPYSMPELGAMVKLACERMGYDIEIADTLAIVKRGRLIPRITLTLLQRCIDMAAIKETKKITSEIIEETMEILGLDEWGLEKRDYQYLLYLATVGRAGVKNIASYLGESVATVEEVIEPWLIQLGFVVRTSKGREITEEGLEALEKYLGRMKQKQRYTKDEEVLETLCR